MTAAPPLAGVVGDPIGHSKSPLVHGYWLRQLGLPGHYVPLHLRAEDLENAFQVLPRLGFVGLNVTIPHKEAVLGQMTHLSEAARAIGAVNTVTFTEEGPHGDNTDAIGFLNNLLQGAPGWHASDGPAALIGAGGAARAVIHALLDAGCPEIRITNRTEARASALAEQFGARVKVVPWRDADQVFVDAATAINGTSLGMAGQPAFQIDLSALSPEALATDLIYTPLQTPFLQAASMRGCRTVDGLGMLLHQAVPGFQRWFGQRPRVTDDLRAAVLAA